MARYRDIVPVKAASDRVMDMVLVKANEALAREMEIFLMKAGEACDRDMEIVLVKVVAKPVTEIWTWFG